MPASPPSGPPDHIRPRQLALWAVFAALLVLGVVLWFRFSGRVVPMLDFVSGR